jgi:hypothetical protein
MIELKKLGGSEHALALSGINFAFALPFRADSVKSTDI